MQTPAHLAQFIQAHQLDAQLITDIGETPTVPAAALALGVQVEQILKTLLFFVRDEPVVVISHGVAPVPTRVLADYFGVGKRRVKLATPQQVLAELGYPVGGVPPIGHVRAHTVLMAQTVFQYHPLFGGGGDDRTMLRISALLLQRLLNPVLLPLA
jgi:prolyl-tRNA editing enzyme YbaK/EbsC (Cys-tRNA(Pro) deacylase)